MARFIIFLFASVLFAQQPDWVARSNQNAQILIAIGAKYGPEAASQQGVPGLDEQISLPTAEMSQRRRADLVKAREELTAKLRVEKDPLVRQDLQILIGAATRQITAAGSNQAMSIPMPEPKSLPHPTS